MVKKKKVKTNTKKKVRPTAGRRAKESTPVTGKDAPLEKLLPADKTAKKKARVKFKSVMLREEAIAYFEAIVAGLKRGSIRIRQGDDTLILKPTPQLDVAVKARSKDQDESIQIEIKWRTAADSDLTISTG